MPSIHSFFACLAALFLFGGSATAGPFVPSGDIALRHDIQRLSDHGVIRSTITTWPMAWAPILRDIDNADVNGMREDVLQALARVRERASWETATQEVHFNTKIGVADNGRLIRSYDDTPRGRAEVSAGLSWIGERLSLDLNVQGVDSAIDDQEFRVDNSMLGIAAGNWSLSLSTMQRWWGPGWDSSLILSNNARPFPSIVIDRLFNDPFKSKWLSWMGPWDLNVMFGELESDRVIPNAQFFGMRFNFRPLPSLELGLTRTAQWCGDGRPCDLDAFRNLLIGKDNRGGEGINLDNEPGNQLAGVDFRWAPTLLNMPVAIYGQFIGEDEAGGFPSRWMGQFGTEWSGYLMGKYSTRVFAEFAGTSCQFYESSEIFDCAYEHGVYRTGYRYRGAAIGHSVDKDARLVSLGASLVDDMDQQWRALVRYGKLNRGGTNDRNTVASEPTELASIDLTHSRAFWFGVLEGSVGVERREVSSTGASDSEARLYVQWRSSF